MTTVETPAAEQFARALLSTAVPCRRPDSDWWTSDDPAERQAAAAACQPCPLIGLCAAVADERGERWCVWGGIDRTHTINTTRQNRTPR